MGCNCKKKVNGKYSDGDDGREKRSDIGKVFVKAFTWLFYVVAFVIALVAVPFAIIAVGVSSAMNRKLTFRLSFLNKYKPKQDGEKQKLQD